jgi:hypothetical protein
MRLGGDITDTHFSSRTKKIAVLINPFFSSQCGKSSLLELRSTRANSDPPRMPPRPPILATEKPLTFRPMLPREAPASPCQLRPTQTNPDKHRSTHANSGQLRPTQTNSDQPMPAQINSARPRPTHTKSEQLRSTRANSDQPRPTQTPPKCRPARRFWRLKSR